MSEGDLSAIPAVVLAAGKGDRMNSDRPKVVHEALGLSLVGHVCRSLRSAGIRRIVVVVGYGREEVRKVLGDDVSYVDQGEPRGTGHAVLAARQALADYSGPLVVLNGDSPLIPPETIRTLVTGLQKLSAKAVFLSACLDDPTGYGRVVRDERGKIRGIVEEAEAGMEKITNEVNAGAYAFSAPEIFDVLRTLRPSPTNGETYLTAAIQVILERGGRVEATRAGHPAHAYGVNTRRDLVAVTNYLRLQVLERHLGNGVTVVDPSTVYIEEDVEIGRDTVIYPYTVLQRGVRIGKRCKIGPFCRIRGNTRIDDDVELGNFVEVKGSRIGKGSRAKHLAYLGDAVLGEGVNIGAGTITANYDGLRKHTTTIEDGARTGCNTVFVAPVRMGRNAQTGAGAIVLRNRNIPAGETVAGVPAHPIKRRPRS